MIDAAKRVAERVIARGLLPVDASSLAAFRVLFGALMCFGALRFLASDFLHALYVEPRFFFTYPGFSWVVVPSAPVVALLYAVLAVCAGCIALGFRYRLAALCYFVGFAYVQLLDVTNYLNHYVLVLLLAAWCVVLPLHAHASLDAKAGRTPPRTALPAWMLWALRAQVGVVYVFAALAKVGPDWLLHAQPLGIWLRARDEMPVLGPLFALPWTPLAMSWAGFLYDASIVPLLSWRRTRAFAFALVVVFHVLTRVLFEIGMFPGIMIVSTTLFFAPSWPRRFLRKAAVPAEGSRAHAPRVTGRAIAVACALVVVALAQVAIPLRHLAYGGSVLWDEQGMRFSWRVMVREKSGSVTYHVTSPARRKTWQVSPHDYLTWRQANEMSGQPDLMLQLAHHIAADFRRRGIDDVEVRAEARVSLNGRAPALLIDPTVDLARVEDSLARASWILPLHDDAPLAAVAIRGAR